MTVCHAVEGKEKESCLGKLSREVVEKGISGLHIFAVKERERESSLFFSFWIGAVVMHQFAAHLICFRVSACPEAVVTKRFDRFLGS